ncbi:MAG: hypothetical protein DRI32_00140 [Chloroflexi bacterium]|nr:MAG: hypothetical protein DRI32_00140 [Chloroflexota bacterium]
MKYITIRFSAQKKSAPKGQKILDIPQGELVEFLDTTKAKYNGVDATWYKVRYRGHEGWTLADNLDPYLYKPKTGQVDFGNLQTVDAHDAQQYVIIDGHRKVNQCGIICTAYCLQVPYPTVVEKWKESNSAHYRNTMAGNRDKGTSEAPLINIFKIFGKDAFTTKEFFRSPALRKSYQTAYRMSEAIKNGYVIIAGVQINRYSGLIQNRGVWHWVVLHHFDWNGGIEGRLTVYNPYNNRDEWVSLEELQLSAKGGIGGVVYKMYDKKKEKDTEKSKDTNTEKDIAYKMGFTAGKAKAISEIRKFTDKLENEH